MAPGKTLPQVLIILSSLQAKKNYSFPQADLIFFWRIYSERERRELYVKCIEDVPVTLCDWSDLEKCK